MKPSWQELKRELDAERDVARAMHALLAKSALREDLAQLPWLDDAERLRWWLFENLDDSPLPESADQLWFRLATTNWGERIDSCDVELSAGTESDQFATPIAQVTWTASNPQLGSVVLPHVAQSDSQSGLELCVAFVALAAQSALRGIDESLLLGSADSVGVTAGFETGPGIYLGRFDGETWDRFDSCHY